MNRTRNGFHDQTLRSGHHDRIDDLELFAALGLKALRYPLLWERISPLSPDVHDWRWTDERLTRIRQLNLRPIGGMLHHGGGPAFTDLLDEAFPRLFAEFARRAAIRYPWIEDWTPINEPLTTARFSALYGLWHPHVRDERAFWVALLNQIEATQLAMAEIRIVNPIARLIQTEDLGRTYGTPAVAHQTEFDNARRWMTWDLLTGRVGPGHALWSRLEGFRLGDRLRRIADAPCPPAVIGVNHYLTSDRFLDHRTEAYPPEYRGGNRFMAFADVAAARVAVPAPGGLEGALEEAWTRYGLPLAVTESHNGCTREDQVRWIRESWDTAQRLRRRGVEVRAVTAWALLGSHDWESLLTREDGRYQSGAFDMRGGKPRPTAVSAELLRLATGKGEPHPATTGPGWWRRDVRLAHQPVFRTSETPEPRREWAAPAASGRPLLVTGATGTLGRAFARACEHRGVAYVLTSRDDLSLDDAEMIARHLEASRAWGVVNTAGWARVDDAEREAAACHAVNAEGAIRLARACAERDLPFVTFSSDLVFDGRAHSPYVESDTAHPLNVYGASKAAAEREILALESSALVVRTAAFFSPYDPHNFAAHVTRVLGQHQILKAADDLVVSPTYVPDLVDATLDLLLDGETGLRHLANPGQVTWAQFAVQLAEALGLEPSLVHAVPAASFGWPAARPAYVPLGTERGQVMPPLADAIARYADRIREGMSGLAPEPSLAAHGGLAMDRARPS